METIGFYAGSFDPFTNGHMQIVKKASKCFSKILVLRVSSEAIKLTDFKTSMARKLISPRLPMGVETR